MGDPTNAGPAVVDPGSLYQISNIDLSDTVSDLVIY